MTVLHHHRSSGSEGAFIAALVPGVNIVKVLLIGLGLVKDEATVRSMSRYGDYRFCFSVSMQTFLNNFYNPFYE